MKRGREESREENSLGGKDGGMLCMKGEGGKDGNSEGENAREGKTVKRRKSEGNGGTWKGKTEGLDE